jgi:hypothetical protein
VPATGAGTLVGWPKGGPTIKPKGLIGSLSLVFAAALASFFIIAD